MVAVVMLTDFGELGAWGERKAGARVEMYEPHDCVWQQDGEHTASRRHRNRGLEVFILCPWYGCEYVQHSEFWPIRPPVTIPLGTAISTTPPEPVHARSIKYSRSGNPRRIESSEGLIRRVELYAPSIYHHRCGSNIQSSFPRHLSRGDKTPSSRPTKGPR